MSEPLLISHSTEGRTPRSVIILTLSLAALCGLWLFGTHWAIVAFLAFFALPRLVDVIFNPQARFELSDTDVRWKNATQEADIALSKVQAIQISTRLNVAFRMVFVMYDGAKVTIPQDVLPPRAKLETALRDLDIPIQHTRLRLI